MDLILMLLGLVWFFIFVIPFWMIALNFLTKKLFSIDNIFREVDRQLYNIFHPKNQHEKVTKDTPHSFSFFTWVSTTIFMLFILAVRVSVKYSLTERLFYRFVIASILIAGILQTAGFFALKLISKLNSKENEKKSRDSQRNIYYSSYKWSFVIVFVLVLIYTFIMFLQPFINQNMKVPFSNPKIFWFSIGLIVLVVYLAFYQKYVLLKDRLKIYYMFNIKPKYILTSGRRLSRFFALPYNIVPSTIFFSDIIEITKDSEMIGRGGSIPCISIKLKSGKKFRLRVRDTEEKNRFITELEHFYKNHNDTKSNQKKSARIFPSFKFSMILPRKKQRT